MFPSRILAFFLFSFRFCDGSELIQSGAHHSDRAGPPFDDYNKSLATARNKHCQLALGNAIRTLRPGSTGRDIPASVYFFIIKNS